MQALAGKKPGAAATTVATTSPPDHTEAWLNFWATTAGHIAWPVVVIVLVIVLRTQLRELLARLTAFEGWGVKTSFSEKVQTFVENVSETATEAQPGRDISLTLEDSVTITDEPAVDALSISPEANVLFAFREVERAVIGAAKRYDLPRPQGAGPVGVAKTLLANGRITQRTYRNIVEAARLRSVATHGKPGQITMNDALSYRITALSLAAAIEEESKKLS